MAQTSAIEWTDATSNPVKYRDRETGRVVWACVKHSAGCAHCYAETLAKRYGRGGPFTKAEMAKVVPFLCDKELRSLLTSKKLTGKRVFIGDMTDVFGEWIDDEMLNRLFAVFGLRPDVTFQVLTKRADRMAAFVGGNDRAWHVANWEAGGAMMPATYKNYSPPWPLPNVWLGVSVENQAAADERIPELLKVPAAVRFLSCEPLLESVDLRGTVIDHKRGRVGTTACNWLTRHVCPTCNRPMVRWTGSTFRDCEWCGSIGSRDTGRPLISWVIVGGESGGGARPCDIAWVRSIVGQCKAAGTPVFVKQLGSKPYDGDAMKAVPGAQTVYTAEQAKKPTPEMIAGLAACFEAADIWLADRKGGDPAEWPADLRVREFPTVGS